MAEDPFTTRVYTHFGKLLPTNFKDCWALMAWNAWKSVCNMCKQMLVFSLIFHFVQLYFFPFLWYLLWAKYQSIKTWYQPIINLWSSKILIFLVVLKTPTCVKVDWLDLQRWPLDFRKTLVIMSVNWSIQFLAAWMIVIVGEWHIYEYM